MADRWIVIPGWSKFQHYPNRNPVWIKIYPELLMDDEWRTLPVGTRSLLAQLWLAFASAHGQLRLDTRSLSQKLAQRVTKRQLVSLRDAGWIEFSDSKPLALGYQSASKTLASRASARSQEQEEETELENPPTTDKEEEGGSSERTTPPEDHAPPLRSARKARSAPARTTGWTWKRSRAGETWIRDPNGTALPPKSVIDSWEEEQTRGRQQPNNDDDNAFDPDPEGRKRIADMLNDVLGGVQPHHEPSPEERKAELDEAERRQAASKAYLAKLKTKPHTETTP